MVVANSLLRIFWPSDALKIRTQGVLIGWRNSPSDVFVACILLDVEVQHGKVMIQVCLLILARPGGRRALYESGPYFEIVPIQSGECTTCAEIPL